MQSVHIPFMQIRQLQQKNILLSEFRVIIRMEGTGRGRGGGGEEKDKLHLCVPSSENSLLTNPFPTKI